MSSCAPAVPGAGICPLLGHSEPRGPSLLGTSSLLWLLGQCCSLIPAGCGGPQGAPRLSPSAVTVPLNPGGMACAGVPSSPGNKTALSADLWSSNAVCVRGSTGIPILVGLGSGDTGVMASGEHSGAFDCGLDSLSFAGLHPECHTRANQHWNVPWLLDYSLQLLLSLS